MISEEVFFSKLYVRWIRSVNRNIITVRGNVGRDTSKKITFESFDMGCSALLCLLHVESVDRVLSDDRLAEYRWVAKVRRKIEVWKAIFRRLISKYPPRDEDYEFAINNNLLSPDQLVEYGRI